MDFTVENAGTTIACREYADPDVSPDAPALVCVHGACVDGTFFDGIACELSRNYRVIAYDRRGCGGSSDAADGSYDLAAQAADLQAVIEHVGAPTNVLAHSAGTLVALELLRTEPHLVARAILHEPAVSAEGVGMGAAPVLLDMIAAGKVSRALRLFLGALGDLDPEAPGTTEAEAKHALRNGRCFMANEYGITMTCVPDWDSVRASKTVAAVLLGEVVDELLNQNGLANAGAAEQARLSATDVGLEQVDGLDAGLEDLGLGGELVETGRCMVDGVELLHLGHGLAVDGLAHNVPNSAERLGANGHLHGLTGIGGDEAALQAVGRGHGDRADDAARKLALDLEDRAQMTDRGLGLDRERVVDRGHRAVKLDVDDRADDSHDATITGSRLLGGFLDRKLYGVISHYCSSNAEAPPTISLISVVIEAWRTRLYVRVRVEMIAVAFSVAECMALRRAPCSAAAESIRAW